MVLKSKGFALQTIKPKIIAIICDDYGHKNLAFVATKARFPKMVS
jgi:hypothetical protein